MNSNTNTRLIRTTNIIGILILAIPGIVATTFMSDMGYGYLSFSHFVFTFVGVFGWIVNASRRIKHKFAAHVTSIGILIVAASIAKLIDSNLIFGIIVVFSCGIIYFNEIISVVVEHMIVSSIIILGYMIRQIITSYESRVAYDIKITIFETAFTLFAVIIADVFFINLIRQHQRQREAIAEQDLTTDELLKIVEAKADEARNATRSKSDFLASMSHEIRTPINSVLGMNEMILRETKEDYTREYANDIQNSGNMLLSLINNILDFSKIESQKMQILPVKYDVSVMMNDLVVMIGSRADSKGLKLTYSIDSNLPRLLLGDEVRIKQIITNILTNAVKYTDSGMVTLKVTFEKADDRSIFMDVSVADTGRGMKPEDINKLFAPFERIEELRNRHTEGTGLGMSITQQLLALMGSKLEVTSEYCKGSVFSFRLRQEVIDWEGIGDYEEAIKKIKSHNKKVAEKEKFTAPNARVLVVDDIQMNLNVFKNLLKRTKVQVDTALDGPTAIDLTRKEKYNVIFLDHMMPGMDGVETMERIRKDRFSLCRQAPMIALTANAISGAREWYMEKGFVDYLSKPVEPNRLEVMIANYLPQELIETNNIDEELEVVREERPVIQILRNKAQLNIEDGINYTGSIENLEEMAREFFNTIKNRSNMIKSYYENGELENYTIQVHALKSTARMIGANDLSEMARKLEQAGKELNVDYIKENTAPLLERYDELGTIMAEAFVTEEADLPLISDEELKKLIDDIRSGYENFDFDLMEGSLKKMETYKMPETFEGDFEKIKTLIADVAIEEIGIWLESRQ